MADDVQETPPEEDGNRAEVIALNDLLKQIGDPDLAHDAGALSDEDYAEAKAKKLAFTAALAAYEKGEVPDVDALLEQMRAQVAEPSQVETIAANVDYLMMTVGGDDLGE